MNKNVARMICVFSAIAVLTVLAYSPALTGDFVNWDDPEYVVNNYSIRSLAPRNIATFFTRPYVGHYAPLTILSYALDHRVYGLNPSGYHATNLALHILNTLLVCALAYALSGRRAVAYVTAALFAVHPLHVESVAWVTERKDVLSAFFYLSSIISYRAFIRPRGDDSAGGPSRSSRRCSGCYWLSLLFFLCALLSKAMAISLPFVLILLDYCYGAREEPGAPGRTGLLRASVRIKIPFFVLSAIFGAVILIISKSGGAMRPAFYRDPAIHALVAARNLVWYVAKMLYPVRLSAFYPYPASMQRVLPKFMLCLFAAGAASIMIVLGRRNRWLLFGALFYLITIFPVIQLIPVGNAIVADRYAYLPSFGILFIAGVLFDRLCAAVSHAGRWGTGIPERLAVYTAICVAIVCLSLLTLKRCFVWQDSERLWSDVIGKYPSVATAWLNMGEVLLTRGRLDEAIGMFKRSAELEPDQVRVYSNLGDAYRKKGLMDEAEKALVRARTLNPADAVVRNNLGLVYVGQNLPLKARNEFERAVSMKADYAEPHNNLGLLSKMDGDTNRAVHEFREAIAINSLFRDAYHNLASTLEQQGNVADGIENYRRAIELKPDFAPVHNDLGLAYARINRIPDAVAEFEKAVQLEPAFAQAYYNLALCYFIRGDKEKAVANRDRATKLGYAGISAELMRL